MRKLFLHRSIASFTLLILFFSLSACGFLNDNPPAPSGVTTTGSSQSLAPVPNSSNNAPTAPSNPSDDSDVSPSMTPQTTNNFFQSNALFSQLSEKLKNRIYQNFTYIRLPGSNASQNNGRVYYNTMFGRTAPVLYTRQGVLDPNSATRLGCDPSGSFICLNTPENGFETVQPGIDIVGNIDLNQLAVFSATDPVLVISVFNNTNGTASIEIPIFPEDVKETENPDVGRFAAATGLNGAGRFTIVVSAFRSINEGAGNELYSIMVVGSRLEAPQIEFVEAVPYPLNKLAASDDEAAPVQNGETIASEFLDVRVRLRTVGGSGIQTRFEDFDENDRLKETVTAIPADGGTDQIITGRVPLHQGLNKIRVTSRSPDLDRLMGENAPLPSVANFSVINLDGGPKIKMLSPRSSGIIPQREVRGEKVNLQFCYTFLPSQSRSEIDNRECVAGRLGFTPEVFMNGKKIEGAENFSCDETNGICTAQVNPQFGINLFEIRSVDQFRSGGDDRMSPSSFSGSFVYGRPVALINNGEINEENTFTSRGLYLDIDRSLIEGEVKQLLVKLIQDKRDQIKDFVLTTFRKTVSTAGYVCSELQTRVVSNGDTSIDFQESTFDLGRIELRRFDLGDDGMVHLGVRIYGMHGLAFLKPVGRSRVTYYAEEESEGGLPLKVDIARLDINLGVTFRRNEDGNQELDLREIPGSKIVEVMGDGELGTYVSVDSSQDPHTIGVEYLDRQQGVIKRQFQTTLESTMVCGIEAGLNHGSGAFGKAVADIEKLTGYNQNFLRIPLEFELLGKAIGLDIAYNIFKANIEIDSDGIHLRNIPLRFNPGPSQLAALAEKYSRGILGSVRRLFQRGDPINTPNLNPTDSVHQISISLGEDAINQALAAASLAGLVDLNVDANFYTNNELTPALRLTPTGTDLASGMDINQDGVRDEVDANTPVMLMVRTNKRVPPMLTFLNDIEVRLLAKDEALLAASANQEPATEEETDPNINTSEAAIQPFFVRGGRYFRLALSDVYITAYRQQPVPASQGGIAQYCKRRWEDPPRVGNRGFCSLSAEALIDAAKYPSVCSGQEMVTLPRLAGDIVSQGLPQAGESDRMVPLYRVKLGLILHGKITGVDREYSAKERLTNRRAPEKTMLHIQMAPTSAGPRALIQSINVLENHTGDPDSAVESIFETILTGAFGSACTGLNEIRVPIPEKFPGDALPNEPEPDPLLPDFGIESLDIGDVDPADPSTLRLLPDAYIDDEGLYLDILAHVGLNFTEEEGSSSGR